MEEKTDTAPYVQSAEQPVSEGVQAEATVKPSELTREPAQKEEAAQSSAPTTEPAQTEEAVQSSAPIADPAQATEESPLSEVLRERGELAQDKTELAKGGPPQTTQPAESAEPAEPFESPFVPLGEEPGEMDEQKVHIEQGAEMDTPTNVEMVTPSDTPQQTPEKAPVASTGSATRKKDEDEKEQESFTHKLMSLIPGVGGQAKKDKQLEKISKMDAATKAKLRSSYEKKRSVLVEQTHDLDDLIKACTIKSHSGK